MRVMLCNNLTCLFLEIFNDLQIDTNRKCRAISQRVLDWNVLFQTSNHWLVGWVDCKMSDSSMRHTKWNSRREFRPGRKRNSINDKSILKPKTNLRQKSCWFAKFGCVPAKMPWTQITAHTNTLTFNLRIRDIWFGSIFSILDVFLSIQLVYYGSILSHTELDICKCRSSTMLYGLSVTHEMEWKPQAGINHNQGIRVHFEFSRGKHSHVCSM